MGSEKFCLSWNDFETNISVSFREIREDKDFFDVTLACGDEQIQAHKLILSACSPFFRSILRKNPHQHPLLYLKGVKYTDLQSVLNFMYHGEVNVAQEELNSFLTVAEDLKVKGLTQNSCSQNNALEPTHKPASKHFPRPPDPGRATHSSTISSPAPPPKRPRQMMNNISSSNTALQEVDEVEEVTQMAPQVKSEPRDHGSTGTQGGIMLEESGGQLSSLEDMAPYGVGGEENYEENSFSGYEEEQTNTYGASGAGDPGKGDKVDFETFLQANATLIEGGKWSCFLCGKITSHIGNMRQHFETYHFKTAESYDCKLCGKQCPTKNALACHKVKCRRRMEGQQGPMGS